MDKDLSPKPLYKSLYFQVITAIVIGVLLGHFYPETGTAMKPFGDGFIKLIKMIIAPIIFCTVVVGIAGMEDMKKVGKTGGLALILGIDRFMSEARALTNLIGNGVATVVVAKWTGNLDTQRLQRQLNNETEAEAHEPEAVLDQVELHMPVTTAAPHAARTDELAPNMPLNAAR